MSVICVGRASAVVLVKLRNEKRLSLLGIRTEVTASGSCGRSRCWSCSALFPPPISLVPTESFGLFAPIFKVFSIRCH